MLQSSTFLQRLTQTLLTSFRNPQFPLGLQYKIGQQFKTVRAFASYEDSRSKVRDAMKSDFSLDGSANLAARSALAAVVSTWEACQRFAEKEAELKAEARVLGIPRPVAQTDRSAMKSSFESAFGAVEESLEPSDEYLASKLEKSRPGNHVLHPFRKSLPSAMPKLWEFRPQLIIVVPFVLFALSRKVHCPKAPRSSVLS